ncbi:zinc finger protein 64 isoform X1 [Boleophthalmus pectinirostris]|uniref:zinc finger protein 64 isoform X1 n=1 Tax=Boleophthalmus pectinirostris TaxID=150288 RepID=UPI002430A7D8|nr:zinc finger protein 64 isoform X1 [Boleophthalmus pectinirostris]
MATYNTEVHSVVLEVSPDIHICGFCKQQFNNLDVFRAHKQNECALLSSDTVASSTAALTDPNTEFVFEETFKTCVMRGAKKSTSKTPKTAQRKVKPALASKRHSCCFSGCTFKTQYGQKDMERHLKTHTGEKPFECELCHKRFSRRDKLNMHSRSHTGEKPHKCKLCSYAAADSSSLKKHMRIHYDERPFKCQICSYASRNSSQLTVHLRSHTGDAPFQCQQCDAKFKINSDLKRHLRIHSGEKPYKCDFCEYRCAMKGNLKSHIHIKHGTDNAFQCTQCDFKCTNKTALRQHSRDHQPTQAIQCSKCSYSCSSKGALKVHERIHSDEKPFKCEFCNFASKQRSNLVIHQKKVHGDKPEDVAKSKSSKNKSSELTKPVSSRYRAKLDAARAFSCDFCDASFVREDSLRSHKKQHKESNMLELQLPTQSNTITLIPDSTSQPNQLEIPTTIGTCLGSGHLKIIVSQDFSNVESSNKANMVLLSQESQNMVVNSMLQQVNLQPIPTSQSLDANLEPQTVLLTQLCPDDSTNSLHQAFLHRPQDQTFICSELESLKALIQEGGTEVTVVTEDNDAMLTPAGTGAICGQALECMEVPTPADLSLEQSALTACEESALLMPNLSLGSQNVVIHSVPLIMSTQADQSEISQLQQTIYCNSDALDSIPQ